MCAWPLLEQASRIVEGALRFRGGDMTNLAKRLRKLEKRLTDASGLVPHSEAWLDYWKRRLEQYLSEGNGIPMEAIDEIDAAGGSEELERWLFSYSPRKVSYR